MAQEFRRRVSVGDVVRYRDGARMLIVDIDLSGNYPVCAWLDLNKKPVEAIFPAPVLALIAAAK